MADPDYFTLAELRALPDCAGSAFTDAQINAAAAYFTAIVEREVGFPFIPRTYTETFDGCGQRAILLGQAYIRSLTSVTVDGVSVSVGSFTTASGVLRYLNWATWSYSAPSNVVVVYSASKYATCPADVKDAVMWATRDRLMAQSDQNDVDIRKTSITTDYGTTSYILPGEKRPTGYPDLDAVIASYVRNTASLGFA